MVKFRQAGYCNLKLLLLYLVIYGHWIEPGIGMSKALYIQYWWIYLLHMPLFAFLSGLFLQSRADCLRTIRKLLPVYVFLQGAITVFSGGNISVMEPFWHLWYLLSNCVWAGAAWIVLFLCDRAHKKKNGKYAIFLLPVAALMGAAAGYIPFLDRTLSGSRTIAFFPFFLLGLFCKADFHWQKYRMWGIGALTVVIAAAFWKGGQIPAAFLYHAEPYADLDSGFGLRLLCYGMSGMLGFFVLTVVPDRRLPCTKAGADTLPVYLLHAPVVGILRENSIPADCLPLLSGILLYIIYKGMQWYSPLYGVCTRHDPGKERRDRLWPGFRKYMNNTEKQYISSS